ncbi:hypothetical protein R3P38DRAFT_1290982 [Favolaschia claudopus]|uniref:Secreted protein n=1 Tax=Favolaschia claudopus TaxID=2862362 RepID=A0AAW0B3N4_9AGAR
MVGGPLNVAGSARVLWVLLGWALTLKADDSASTGGCAQWKSSEGTMQRRVTLLTPVEITRFLRRTFQIPTCLVARLGHLRSCTALLWSSAPSRLGPLVGEDNGVLLVVATAMISPKNIPLPQALLHCAAASSPSFSRRCGLAE